MFVDLVLDQVAGPILSTLTMAVWNRPEFKVLRNPIENYLESQHFRSLTRDALADLRDKSRDTLPDLFDEGFITSSEVQRILTAYIVNGDEADVDRLVLLYGKRFLKGGQITDGKRKLMRDYLWQLRETFASDETYGPVLVARDLDTMQTALDGLYLRVDTGISLLNDRLDALLREPEVQALVQRKEGLPATIERKVVPLLIAQVESGVDLQAAAYEALGTDFPALRPIRWTEPPESLTRSLATALVDAAAYPGRHALVALLLAVRRHDQVAQRDDLDRVIDLVTLLTEARPRPDLTENGRVMLTHMDEALARTVAEGLREIGLTVWLDADSLRAGVGVRQQRDDALETAEIVVAIVSEAALVNATFRRDVAAALRLKKRLLPVQVGAVDMAQAAEYDDIAALADLTPIAPDGDSTATVNAVIAALSQPTSGQSPFKGLESFQEKDAALFFGRESIIISMTDRAKSPRGARFLAVVGGSGSGKSSLVRAGLLPRLREAGWMRIIMTPGERPLHTLVTRLTEASPLPEATVRESLQASASGLHDVITTTLADTPPSTRFVLVVDQFEELFTQAADSADRASFIENLYHAATMPDGRTLVIVTMRADYFGHLSDHPKLAALFRGNDNPFIATRLEPDDLLQAIRKPANVVGLRYESGLPERILRDVESEPGALPLLQFALQQLYERRDGNALTIAAYESIGGIRQALANHAEAVYLGLSRSEADGLRRLLLALVIVDPTSGEILRRRRTRGDLVFPGVPEKQIDLLIGLLTAPNNRLLVTNGRDTDSSANATVEVSHEALLTHWERCRQWVRDNEQAIIQRDEYEEAAQQWSAAGRNPADVLRGARLAAAQEWIASDNEFVTRLQREFIAAGTAQANRRQRVVAGVLALVSLLAVAAVIAAVIALQQTEAERVAREDAVAEAERADTERDRANEAVLVAQSGRVALLGQFELQQGRIDNALLLGIEAFNLADSPEARGTLLSSLQSVEQLTQILHIHGSTVTTVDYSPNGETFASADMDGQIIIWDAQTGAPLGLPISHGDLVWSVAFTPDSTRLLSAGNDGHVRVWNVETGLEARELLQGGDQEVAYDVSVSPDGIFVLVAYQNSLVPEESLARVWDLETGDTISELFGHTDTVYTASYNSRGTQVATGSADGTINIWSLDNIAEPELLTKIDAHTNWVWDVEFSPDNSILASGSADDTLKLWDVETGEQIGASLTDHNDWVRDVAFSPDGTQLASASGDGTVILRDGTTGQRIQTISVFTAHADEVWEITFAPNGDELISASEDTQVMRWNTAPSSILSRVLAGNQSEIYDVRYSGDNILTASIVGANPPQVLVWNAGTGRIGAEPFMTDTSILTLDVAPSGEAFVIGGDNGEVRLIRLPDYIEIWSARLHGGTVRDVTFSPDGMSIATASDDGNILLLSAETGTPVTEPLNGHGGEWVRTVTFSPDGETLISGGDDGQIIVWDVATGRILENLEGHDDVVEAVAVSSDGRWIASASRDDMIFLWDVDTEFGNTFVLEGHTNWVLDVAFSPDSRYLVSASRDETARLWDVNTGRAIGNPLTGHDGWVFAVDYAPDGASFTTGSRDGTARVWQVDVAAWQDAACAIANRNLTPEEWARFVDVGDYAETCP